MDGLINRLYTIEENVSEVKDQCKSSYVKKRGNENPFTFKLQSEATLATDMLKFPHCVIMIVSPSWGHSGGGERVGSLGGAVSCGWTNKMVRHEQA